LNTSVSLFSIEKKPLECVKQGKIMRVSAFILTATLFTSNPVFAEGDFASAYSAYQSAVANEKYSDAVMFAEKALALGIEKFKNSDENKLNLRFNLGIAYAQNNQHEEAYKLLDDLYEDFESFYGETSLESLQVQIQLMQAAGKLHARNPKYAKKFKSFGRSVISLAEDVADDRDEAASSAYYMVVDSLSMLGDIPVSFRKLVPFVEKAEAQLLKNFGQDDTKTVRVQFYLAKLYKGQKNYDDAIAQFERLVGTLDDALSFSHPYELSAHAQLVDLYEKKDLSDKATEHCIAIGKMTPWDDNIDPVPLYRQNPKYPLAYASSGREGWVELSFDITPSGFVDNIAVLRSEGGASFEDRSIKALSDWRYAPKFENGAAVTASGKKVRLDFFLQP
jgi:TonB family protein